MIGHTCRQHSHAESLAQDDAGEGIAHLCFRYLEVNLDFKCIPEDLKCMGALPKTALSSRGMTLPIQEFAGNPLAYT